MIPLCVITYKHPKYDFIDRVMKDPYYNENNKFNRTLYYFIYDMDFESYSYDYYKTKFSDLHFVKVPYPEWKTCARMRCFVQNYMKDFDKFWFFDNDIGLKFMFKNLETNRLDRKYITEIFDEYENCSELDSYGLVGFTQNWHSLLTPSNEVISKGYVMQAFLVNNKVLKTKNISYTGDANVAEDFEIMLNCRLNNINFGVISKYVYTYVSMTNGNNWYSVDKMVQATYEKYKHTKLIKIATNKKGALKLHLLQEPELKINLWEM